jgi:hypothetical protein
MAQINLEIPNLSHNSQTEEQMETTLKHQNQILSPKRWVLINLVQEDRKMLEKRFLAWTPVK